MQPAAACKGGDATRCDAGRVVGGKAGRPAGGAQAPRLAVATGEGRSQGACPTCVGATLAAALRLGTAQQPAALGLALALQHPQRIVFTTMHFDIGIRLAALAPCT